MPPPAKLRVAPTPTAPASSVKLLPTSIKEPEFVFYLSRISYASIQNDFDLQDHDRLWSDPLGARVSSNSEARNLSH